VVGDVEKSFSPVYFILTDKEALEEDDGDVLSLFTLLFDEQLEESPRRQIVKAQSTFPAAR